MKTHKFQFKRNKMRGAFFLFMAPSFLGILLFVLLPFLDVFKRSFTTAENSTEYRIIKQFLPIRRLSWR